MSVGISVVVPVKDEVENVGPLAREIASAITGEPAAEIIFIDDGSSDGTADALKALKLQIPRLRVIQHSGNLGQSRAIRTGVRAARFDIIVTLDGDGQNDPADIPKLLSICAAETDAQNIGVVSGVRARRQDTFSRKMASRAGNGIRERLLNDGATDTRLRAESVSPRSVSGPPLFRSPASLHHRADDPRGLWRAVCSGQSSRTHARRSKYTNLNRMLVSVNDLLGVRWLQRRYRGKTEARGIDG